MIIMIIRFFGLKGSWKWACRKMKEGYIIRPGLATGSVKYKIDDEDQGRIQWSFDRAVSYGVKDFKWENANIFLKDFEKIDWEIFGRNK